MQLGGERLLGLEMELPLREGSGGWEEAKA